MAVITALSYNYLSAKSRDKQREANVSVIANSLEGYHDQYGEYPGCVALQSTPSVVTTTTLTHIQPSVLLAPKDESSNEGNSLACNDFQAVPNRDFYAYVAENSQDCQTGEYCQGWELKYKLETTGEIKVIRSRHNSETVQFAIAPPTGLVVEVAISGGTATGIASGGACTSGAILTREFRSASSITETLSDWSSWKKSSELTLSTSPGWQYGFQQRAHCTMGQRVSEWSYADDIAVQSISRPSSPSLAVTPQASQISWSWEATSCPSGTIAEYQGFSESDSGYTNGWYGPYRDYTSRGWITDAEGYEFTVSIQTRCTTPNTVSSWSESGSMSYIRPVTTPAAPDNYAVSFAEDRLSYEFTWDAPPCGLGAYTRFRFNLYIEPGQGWVWTDTNEAGWLFGETGWSEVDNWNPSLGVESVSGPFPSGLKTKTKTQYLCTNPTTERKSSLGPAAESPMMSL